MRDRDERQDRDDWRDRRREHRERWHEERDRMREEFRRHHRHGRKGRVLHTRVSEQLSEDIRRLAEDLRVPASNLVRNVLEEVFDAVENASEDVGEVFEDVLAEADAARRRIERQMHRRRRRRRGSQDEDVERELRRDEAAEAAHSGPSSGRRVDPTAEQASEAEDVEPVAVPEFPDVIGWQLLVLNTAASCGVCQRPLRRGDRAYVGLKETGFSAERLCRRCVPAT